MSPTPELTPRQLAYLTEVDHRDHEALVAIEPSSRNGLAVARYVRSREHPEQAEFPSRWRTTGSGAASARCCCATSPRAPARRDNELHRAGADG